MLLTELATIVDGELRILWNSHLGIWQADINGCEIKGDGTLSGCWGGGETPDGAAQELASGLAGQRIVFNAYGPNRREFSVPKDLRGY